MALLPVIAQVDPRVGRRPFSVSTESFPRIDANVASF
jgi:hypothetical protein